MVDNDGKPEPERISELIMENKELTFQIREKADRASELAIASKEFVFQNGEKANRAAELAIANKELVFQNGEKANRAAELAIANKELAFQNGEKADRAAELIIANKELAFQISEKAHRASELIIANKEIEFQSEENAEKSAELLVANKELAFQNGEKADRAAELVIANKELAFQSGEKADRAAELIIANKELAFQNDEKEKLVNKLIIANEELKNEIIERKIVEEKIRYFVYHDALTGIANRKKLLEITSILIKNRKEKFAVLFIDLDKFKDINDTFGHEVGDLVLVNVAERLEKNTRSKDIVSRIDGDEFIVIIRDVESSSSVTEIAGKLVKVLGDTFFYKDILLYVGASVGISLFPEHGSDEDTLIKYADLAMYEVKKVGGHGYILYDNIMNENNIHMLETEKNLKNSMEKNEFITYYQPIIDLKSMKVLSAESLIRWKPEEKLIQPIDFIPIAKKIGKMVEIDNWMLDSACAQCKKWQELGAKDFSISVNTSYKQLIQCDFVKLVMNILHDHSLDPMYLNLEITEDETMEDIDLITKVLLELKSMGIKISMDDFGTGYSSVSWLSNLPIDTIKIDRSLIMNLDNNSKFFIIIKSIIAVANSLNIKVIAEGIETKTEFATLEELQCDYIQGYIIGKPMGASDFEHNFIQFSHQ